MYAARGPFSEPHLRPADLKGWPDLHFTYVINIGSITIIKRTSMKTKPDELHTMIHLNFKQLNKIIN